MKSGPAGIFAGVVALAITAYLVYSSAQVYSTLTSVITGIAGVGLTVLLIYAAHRLNLVVACVLAGLVGSPHQYHPGPGSGYPAPIPYFRSIRFRRLFTRHSWKPPSPPS